MLPRSSGFRRRRLPSKAALAFVWLAALPAAAPGEEGPLPVVSTFVILHSWVQAIGGKDVQADLLVGPESELHAFEPSPGHSRTLAAAAVVYAVGLGLEPWLPDLQAASGSPAKIIYLGDGMPILRGPDGADPHLWMDPDIACFMAVTIAETLMERRPQQAAQFEERSEALIAAIRQADRAARDLLEPIPTERRLLVAAHDAFRYWADHYGFTIPGNILPANTASEWEPSPREMARLADTLRAAGVPALFPLRGESARLLEQVARAAGLPVGGTLYAQTLDAPGNGPVTDYPALLRHNAQVLRKALAPPPGPSGRP